MPEPTCPRSPNPRNDAEHIIRSPRVMCYDRTDFEQFAILATSDTLMRCYKSLVADRA